MKFIFLTAALTCIVLYVSAIIRHIKYHEYEGAAAAIMVVLLLIFLISIVFLAGAK